MPKVQSDITAVIENFARQLVAATEAAAAERIQTALATAFGAASKRGPGRPKQVVATAAAAKKGRPKQLCPVPGCKNAAAPVFGMVCAEHKNVSKAKIKKYREARKAKGTDRVAASAAKARKPMKMSPKLARARKLQGQYLGALRGLADADKAKVKQVAKDKGVPEALKIALSLKAARK
jgi:hypothetical protein